MTHLKYIIAALLSGTLLALSWPHTGNQEYLIFLGFVPLFWLERNLSTETNRHRGLLVFTYAYLAFMTFNLGTTWWIKLASFGGMVLAEVFNSLFMALVFLFFHYTRRYLGDRTGYLSLIIYWLGFEWLHINWELSWIWLNLGNVFANRVEWIQWYEWTGTFGGSLWILSANILLFLLIHEYFNNQARSRKVILSAAVVFLIGLPLIVSKWVYNHYEEEGQTVEVVVVQPNIDPYHDKFEGMTEVEQIDRLMHLSDSATTPQTDLIFAPETAFPMGYWEDNLENIYGVQQLRKLVEKYPRAKYVTGLSTNKLYQAGEETSPTARPFKDNSGRFYDQYNTAMMLGKDESIQLYHKSKLVLGVEKIPFQSKLKFLDDMAINLGGAFGSLGTEKEAVVFRASLASGSEAVVIPAVCYESIYAEYLTEFVHKGANLLAVITNDGWWGNTPGYSQHLAYSRLRAIEMRRSVARSANTGISALINQRGDILARTEWWTPAALRGKLKLNNVMTFYSQFGDYIGRTAAFFSLLLLAWTIVKFLRRNARF